jgi:hypothetical protein
MSRCPGLALLCVLACLGRPALADEPFQVDTSSRLTFPLRTPADHFAIAINFDPSRYALSSVTMQPTSNGPGGVPLMPNDDAALSLAAETGPGHAVLDLKPRSASFRFPGEYRIALNVAGHTLDAAARPVSSSVTLSILRLEPQIDIQGLSGRSTTLYRTFPWSAAAGSLQYPLQSLTSSDAATVSVAPLGLEWISTRELVPDAHLSVSPALLNLQPGRPQNLVVNFAALKYAGDFTTTLAFDSDSFTKRQLIGISVHVKDLPWMPLAVILLGVVGGAVVTWMSGTRRNTLRTRYRLSELRLRLQKLAPAIVTPASANRYREVSVRIDELERGSQVDRVADSELVSVTEQAADLERALAATQAGVITQLGALDAQIAALNTVLSGDVPDIGERTRPVSDKVAAVRAMDRGGQYEYAAQQTAAAEQMFQVVSRDARAVAVEDLSLKISAHLPSGADKHLTAKINELRRLVTTASLDEFAAALRDLHGDLQHLGFAPQVRAGLQRVPSTAPAVADYAVVVKTAQRSCITGQRIDMDIVVGNGRPVPDRVVWNFGNGALEVVGGALNASPVYDWPGPYSVSAQLYRDADASFHETATTSLGITAGSAARQVAGAMGALVRNEVLVMSIALLLAAATGLLQLYVDKSFGSPEDYLVALLWGFGVEKSIRGFNAVYSTLGQDRNA